MDRMKLRYLIITAAALISALAITANASAASSGTFKVTSSGTQSLSWSVSGTRGSCEIQTGSGSGATSFSFKSAKAASLYVSKSGGIVGSLTSGAKGDQTGTFTESYTPCPGFENRNPFVADASGCGARKFDVRMDFKTTHGLTYVVGPAQQLPGGVCPTFGDYLSSSDLTACGDSDTQYKRSWGLSYGGIGLFATKMNISMKSLLKLKKGKKKTLTGKATIDCKPASTYSNPVVLKGELKYSLTFKRSS
jgi:hypothetical protein